jgi:hypothetical protein
MLFYKISQKYVIRDLLILVWRYNIFLMFKHSLFLKYQHNKYMFNFIDIYIILPVSGCVGRGPSALLFSGCIMPLRM